LKEKRRRRRDRVYQDNLFLIPKEIVCVHILLSTWNSMIGLGKWASAVEAVQSARLKARKKILSQGKSLLSTKEPASGSGESAAVHFVQSDLVSFSDGAIKSDNDPAVERTVETLTVAGSDDLGLQQEKEARSSGGIPSR
jgi:hypothetical protein